MSTRIRGMCGLQAAGAVLTAIVWLLAGQIRAADSSTVTPSIQGHSSATAATIAAAEQVLPRGTGRERGRRMSMFRGGSLLRQPPRGCSSRRSGRRLGECFGRRNGVRQWRCFDFELRRYPQ